MNIIYLVLSGCCEVVMVYCLKKSEGFKNKWGFAVLGAALASLLLLSQAMTTLEAGVAYSIWVAFGSIGSLLLGAFFFNEKLKQKQLIYIGLIIVSVIGLKIF